MSSASSVVVTGLGAISPAGIGVGPLWHAARDGKSCGGPLTRFTAAGNKSRIVAEVRDFDPATLGLSAKQIERMDRVTQFSVLAARMAWEDSGLQLVDPTRVGVMVGTAIGGVGFMERVFRSACVPTNNGKPSQVAMREEDVSKHVYSGFLAHSVSSEVACDHNLIGPCSTMATGCTAGIDAIGTAADVIESGLADVMITGGADAPITPIVVSAFDNISCLTTRNDDPLHASRPFDRHRDGFLLAEGCGMLVLESLEHARRRGARIYGSILGYASLSNAYHMTSLPADGAALAITVSRALCRSRLNPDQVDYVNAHGSSTQQNDRNETSAFKRVFKHRAGRIPISSTKSVVGHSLGAASALECIVCLCALGEGVIPPTANYETPDPDCDLDYVPNQPRESPLARIECNASGFSGIHSSIILAS
jgi:3-oxoacyl-(acyl-carrier-protein) synthase